MKLPITPENDVGPVEESREKVRGELTQNLVTAFIVLLGLWIIAGFSLAVYAPGYKERVDILTTTFHVCFDVATPIVTLAAGFYFGSHR